MADSRAPLLQGTLDLLILKTLSWSPRHGYGIARWIEDTTADALRIEEGSLYPALYRLQRRRLISAQWGISDAGKRIKVYALTNAGRTQLKTETADWGRIVAAMALVLEPARG
jgi:transcriptional regulator